MLPGRVLVPVSAECWSRSQLSAGPGLCRVLVVPPLMSGPAMCRFGAAVLLLQDVHRLSPSTDGAREYFDLLVDMKTKVCV